MAASKWKKLKKALSFRLCAQSPPTLDGSSPSVQIAAPSPAVENSAAVAEDSDHPSVTGSEQLSESGSKSFKKTCAICLGSMKPGHALFTAECSHTFHFNCISSNVKHGNYICPICRAKWKEIPCRVPSSDHPHRQTCVNPVNWSRLHDNNSNDIMTLLHDHSRRSRSPNRPRPNRNASSQTPEPATFNDDEALDLLSSSPSSLNECLETVDIKMYPEFKAVEQSVAQDNFAILIHLKAPQSVHAHAPIDLVAVVDISGSMSGTKLALLKRAMCFLIQNLSPSDRLSVVAFSTSAHRLFHLRRMSESGCQLAMQAINSLACRGGTNISEGLQKGMKIIKERKERNPVSSIILLSDGQDTQRAALPTQYTIPVHSFGFGDDHDPASMHAISENSGGTFSYIESESMIQDAFAQRIGGLLSVVAQVMEVRLESVYPGVKISSIKSGSYVNELNEDHHTGLIHVGDLYAEEERDFLVNVTLPQASEEMTLLTVDCIYKDPVSNEITLLEGNEVNIQRPASVAEQIISMEVDRERNRLQVAKAMAEAKAAAERSDLKEAASILENCHRLLLKSQAGRAGDRVCADLDAELKELRERMSSRQRYNVSGRAYVLSGLSSHAWQRATARGDSMNSVTFQTPSMVEMLQRSQTFGVRPRRGAISGQFRQARSFNLRTEAS